MLKIKINTKWNSNTNLHEYLIGKFRGKYGNIVIDDIKNNSSLDTYFEIYYNLEVLKLDIPTMLKKWKLDNSEMEAFNLWKNETKNLDLGTAMIILFCIYNANFVSAFINDDTVKEVKKCLSDLLYYVIFYYESKSLDEKNGAACFMHHSFYCVSKIEGYSFGNDAWHHWKEHHKIKFEQF